MVPTFFFNISAGLLFGPIVGTIAFVVGAVGSALIIYWLGSMAHGKEELTLSYGGKWGRKIHSYLKAENAFLNLLWLRLVPIFPYDIVSALAGCIGSDLKIFVATTFLGILPGAVAYTLFSNAFATGEDLYLGIGLLIIAFGLPLLIWYKRKGGKNEREN